MSRPGYQIWVGDQLPAAANASNRVSGPFAPEQGIAGVDLDDRQRPPGGRDRITFVGVGFLANPQRVELAPPICPVDEHGKGLRDRPPRVGPGVWG